MVPLFVWNISIWMFSIACSQEHFLIKIKSVKYSQIFSEFPTAGVYSLGSSHGAEIMYTNILLSPAKQTLICIHFSLCFTIHIHIPPPLFFFYSPPPLQYPSPLVILYSPLVSTYLQLHVHHTGQPLPSDVLDGLHLESVPVSVVLVCLDKLPLL